MVKDIVKRRTHPCAFHEGRHLCSVEQISFPSRRMVTTTHMLPQALFSGPRWVLDGRVQRLPSGEELGGRS
jgi:hypothetical protein